MTEIIAKPAPIAVFVYNRPQHARDALLSILSNPEASESLISVYCDGPRSSDDVEAVEATRQTVREIVPRAERIERSTNLGLAESVINGVTRQCEEHGQVIVVEDDLVLSPVALGYLNLALERYRNEDRVMHVSAYMFPVQGELPSAFFYREATCWGWATWARAWAHFEPDPRVIRDRVRAESDVSEFNIRDSMYFWEMLEAQIDGRIDSWAIRWYGSMFLRGGLALHPWRSLVENHGFDGSGVHSAATTDFEVKLSETVPEMPEEIRECEEAVTAMIDYRTRQSEVPGGGKFLGFLRRALEHLRRVFSRGGP